MKWKVLLVDDDPMMLRLLRHQLVSAGYEVTVVDNAAEALSVVRAEAPPIIITDWMMPGMDGLDLCRALRSDECVSFVYIILLTAHNDADRLVEAFDAGVDDYLAKPVNRKELIARLRAAQRIAKLQEDLDRNARELQLFNAKMAVTSRQLQSANIKLRQMATTDELTGLFNRREAMARLTEHWSVATRHREPLSCIVLDIDHFKRFNDTHGHAVGDLVLKEVSAVLRSAARTGEAVCRVGGEEFLILCPKSSVDMAARGGERFRAVVESQAIQCGPIKLSVTISVGIAERSEQMGAPDDLLKAADDALYAAKAAGRNTIRCYGHEKTSPAPNRTEPPTLCVPEPVLSVTTGGNTACEHVLVVDADHLRRQVCRQALEPAGYHVTETDDATGALTRIQSDPPDQVLLHADLPQAGAHKITRQLKADILTRSIPVILLVDAAEQDSIIEWLEAGIDDYVILPMEPHRLVLRMRFAAWQRESHRALLDINEDRGEQARAMAVLLDFSHQVAVDNNLDRLLDSTIKAVAELTCSRRISIMLADAERQVLNIARAVGIDETFASKVRVPVGMSTSGTVFQTCQSVIINSEEEAGEYKLDIDCPVFASVPMISTALTTSEHVVGVLNITERQGARPFTPWDIECIHLIANMAASAIHAICTRTTFDHARDSIVVALARLAEHRDPDTGRHLDRVTRFAVMIAEELRTFPSHRDVIDDDFLKSMELAVPLHDIGKVAIPVHILLKPGRLSLDEMDAMRTHAEIGAKTIESAIERATETLFLRMAKDIALGHHEWYDGTGYPRGVRGEDNPLSARITALADVYDAITSKRVYKEAMSHEQAVTLIVDARGSQFDPDVVAAFINRQDDFQQLADQLADTPEELADKTPAREHVEAALAGVPNA